MTNQPNILLITTDQQRFDTIRAAGYAFMKTPNLDRLASQGCLYENAFSNNPACIPARHNIITGLTCKHHGFEKNYFDDSKQLPHDIPTFPKLLADDGYDTVAIGKMHFAPVRAHHGFNRMYLMEEIPKFLHDDEYAMYLQDNGFEDFQSFHGVRHHLYMLPQQSMLPVEHHGTTWVANKTIETIKQKRGDTPFMIWSSFIEPHPPFDVPSEWAHLYDDVAIPSDYDSITPVSAIVDENKAIAEYHNESDRDRAKRLYYCAISFVDHHIGRILDTLEATGQIDNTLIVFTSDHGEMLGDLNTYQKFLPYDGSSRVPFIVRYPKYCQPGTKDKKFVDLNDLLPTFLDLASITYPAKFKLLGESIFTDVPHKDRGHQYIEHEVGNKRWISLRNERYKYNYYYGGGKEELFDLKKDPKEQTNLLHTEAKAYEAIRLDLASRLLEYEKEWGLTGYVVNDQFIELEPYVAHPFVERNYPLHVKHLDEKEQMKLKSLEDEIDIAIQNEPLVHKEYLNL